MCCFSVLQEVPIQLLLHPQSHLHHMVAVISYNLAQVSSSPTQLFHWFLSLAHANLEGEEHVP